MTPMIQAATLGDSIHRANLMRHAGAPCSIKRSMSCCSMVAGMGSVPECSFITSGVEAKK
jgi:hypothetical protein